MAGKSVLLKLTPEAHAQVLGASERHQRSMQKLLVALIEGWLAQGAPDPIEFAPERAGTASTPAAPPAADGADQQARQAIDLMAQKILELQSSVQGLQQWRDSADRGTNHDETYWDHFSEALDALVRQGADAATNPLQALINQSFAEQQESSRSHPSRSITMEPASV